MSDRRHNLYPFESRDARLRFAARAAGFGTYDLDCTTGDSIWSPELQSIAGLPTNTPPLSTEQTESLIHPEDRQRFREKLNASLQPTGSGEFEDELRIQRTDGGIRWVRAKGRTFFVGEGRNRLPLAATGVVMDITASRIAEKALAESREELEKMVGAAIDCIITIDAEQRIIRFSPSAARMFGCSPDEVMGASLERFMPERFRAGHADKVRAFAESTEPAKALDIPRHFVGLRQNGEEFLFEATLTKVNMDGRSRMTTFMRDVTERVNAEEALRRSKEDLELAVQGANIGVWHWDVRTNQVVLSERCHHLFGIPNGKQLTFERVLEAIHPEDRANVTALLSQALDEGKEYKFEKRFIWPDGSVHWLECMGRDLYDERTGKVIGMRGVSIDLTERKRHEQYLQHSKEELESRVEARTAELQGANEALERSNMELQQFAFIAAHDLQTPLRSISSFAQLLQKEYGGRLDPQADVWLDQLSRSAHRMHELIRDVLMYSRVESRGNTFDATDVNQLFDEVVESLDASLRETNGRVTRDELPPVLGDRAQLGQVFQNLIENGIKYRGEEPPQVHVSASLRGQEWVFSVRDNGIGIAEKHQERIFDIFHRLHTQQEYAGTGIGLAICRRIIHRHGGRIWVESEPGQGSTFYFTLPVM